MTQACNTRITGFYQNVLEFKSTYLVIVSVSPLDSRRRLCENYKNNQPCNFIVKLPCAAGSTYSTRFKRKYVFPLLTSKLIYFRKQKKTFHLHH